MDIDRKKCRRDANYECECACRLQSDRLAICMSEDETRAFSSARLTRICGCPLPRDGCIVRRSNRASFSFVAKSMELNCQRERTAVFRGFPPCAPSAISLRNGLRHVRAGHADSDPSPRKRMNAVVHLRFCARIIFSNLKNTGTASIALRRCSQSCSCPQKHQMGACSLLEKSATALCQDVFRALAMF